MHFVYFCGVNERFVIKKASGKVLLLYVHVTRGPWLSSLLYFSLLPPSSDLLVDKFTKMYYDYDSSWSMVK